MLPNKKTYYLKQYTAYHLQSDSQVHKINQTLIFPPLSQYNIVPQLPTYIIDSQSQSQKLYFLKWHVGTNIGSNVQLYLTEFNKNICYCIEMNKKPDFVAVGRGLFYAVSGGLLHIVDLEQQKTGRSSEDTMSQSQKQYHKSYQLGDQPIYAIQLSVAQGNALQHGINVYSWNQIKGYRKRFYSMQRSIQTQWWKILAKKLLFQKAPRQYKDSYLTILIPSVLGLILLPSRQQFTLINLTTMQILQSLTIKLTNWSITKPHNLILKYYFNLPSKNFDDSLLISISQKNRENIQLYVLHLKYLQEMRRRYDEQYGLTKNGPLSIRNCADCRIVDWSSSALKEFMTISVEGGLRDYLLLEKEVIFYADDGLHIPKSGFISYAHPLHTHPILALEHNIGNQYISDNKIYNQIEQLSQQLNSNITQDPQPHQQQQQHMNSQQLQYLQDQITHLENELKNSLMKPNKYVKEFLFDCLGVRDIRQLDSVYFGSYGNRGGVGSLLGASSYGSGYNSSISYGRGGKIVPLKILVDWYKNFKVQNLILYKGDILINRGQSLSSLLPITQQQYKSQYLPSEIFIQTLNKPHNQSHLTQPEHDQPYQLPHEEYNQKQLSINMSKFSLNMPNAPYQDQFSLEGWYGEIRNVGELAFCYEKNDYSFGGGISNQYDQQFQKYVNHFLQKIMEGCGLALSKEQPEQIQEFLVTRKLLSVSHQLIENRTKDALLFHAKILKYLYPRIQQISNNIFFPRSASTNSNQNNKQAQQIFHKNSHKLVKLLLNYMNFLINLLEKPFQQIQQQQQRQISERDLIGHFIWKEFYKVQLKIFEDLRKSEEKVESTVFQSGLKSSRKDLLKDSSKYVDSSITIDVQKQVWKIISSLFRQLLPISTNRMIFSSPVSLQSPQTNPFITYLLDASQTQQYILSHLQHTFFPYSLADIGLYYTSEEKHYPFTRTLLSVYSRLKFEGGILEQVLWGFVLQSFGEGKGGEDKSWGEKIRYMDIFLNSCNVDDQFKNRIRQIANKFISIKNRASTNTPQLLQTQNYSQFQNPNNLTQTSQSIKLQSSSSNTNRKTIPNSYLDTSHGIINLAKLIQPQILQRELKNMDEDQLERAFKVLEEIQAEKIGKEVYEIGRNFRKERDMNMRLEQDGFLYEDIIVGEILRYRVYIHKFQQLLTKLSEKNSTESNSSQNQHKLKLYSIRLLQKCIISLQNVHKYYNLLYKFPMKITQHKQDSEQNRQPIFRNIEDPDSQQTQKIFIKKVICVMIGYQNYDGLFLYENMTEKLYPNFYSSKILGTTAFLKFLLNFAKNQETNPNSLTKFSSILTWYFSRIFSFQQQNGQMLLDQISNYFSKQFLADLINSLGFLRDQYVKCVGSEKGRPVLNFFEGFIDSRGRTNASNRWADKIQVRRSLGRQE